MNGTNSTLLVNGGRAATSRRWLAALAMIGMMALTSCNFLPDRPATSSLTVVIPHGTIVVYAKPACPYCRQAKEYLTRQRIAFVERDIEHDAAALEEMLALYRKRLPDDRVIVPLIVTDGQIISGYNEEELALFVEKHNAAASPD
jgi:glutaredoxin